MKRRMFAAFSLLSLTACLLSPSTARADMEFVSTTYSLRWGNADTNDTVTPANRLGGPVCFKMGSTLAGRLVSNGGVYKWSIGSAKLTSKVDGHVYWTYTNPNPIGSMILPSQTWPLPNIPSNVDWCNLEVQHNMQLGQFGPPYYLAPLYTSETFIVLDTPKAPMATPWIPVLRYSCLWAMGDATATAAAQHLTTSLYMAGIYNGGFPAYTTGGPTGQTFYLKAFLADTRNPSAPHPPWGQCDDFSDFLVCLITSVGGNSQQSKRAIGPFTTNPITATGSGLPGPGGAGPRNWSYHQFTDFSSSIWDGCIAFNGTTIPVNVALATYLTSLVPGGAPTSASFLPTVTAAPWP